MHSLGEHRILTTGICSEITTALQIHLLHHSKARLEHAKPLRQDRREQTGASKGIGAITIPNTGIGRLFSGIVEGLESGQTATCPVRAQGTVLTNTQICPAKGKD